MSFESIEAVVPPHAVSMNELRYAALLSARTARLYKHLAAVCTFIGILGGSGTLTALASQVPAWVSVAGAVLLTVAGAVMLVVRPAEKVAANMADARKHAELQARGVNMSAKELHEAKLRAYLSDTEEVEALRTVAWNDVMREIGAVDCVKPLRAHERLVAALA